MIPQAIFAQVRRMLRPLETKVANLVAQAVIQFVNDSGTRQTAQVGVMAGETLDGVQHFLPYGLTSVPLPGAEGVLLFVDGDRGHPLLLGVDDRSARPTGGEPGDTGLYHFDGAQVRLTSSGDILISCKPGQKVFINDGSGSEALATLADVQQIRSELNGHEHTYVPGMGTPTTTTGGPSVTSPTGTTVLEGK